jgi:hypothetical protein
VYCHLQNFSPSSRCGKIQAALVFACHSTNLWYANDLLSSHLLLHCTQKRAWTMQTCLNTVTMRITPP